MVSTQRDEEPRSWGIAAAVKGRRVSGRKERSCASSSAQWHGRKKLESLLLCLAPHHCTSPVAAAGLGLCLIKRGRFLVEAPSPLQKEQGLERKGRCYRGDVVTEPILEKNQACQSHPGVTSMNWSNGIFFWPQKMLGGEWKGTSSLPQVGTRSQKSCPFRDPSRETLEGSLLPDQGHSKGEQCWTGQAGPAQGQGVWERVRSCWGLSSLNWATGGAFNLPPSSLGHSGIRLPLPLPSPLPPSAAITALIRAL